MLAVLAVVPAIAAQEPERVTPAEAMASCCPDCTVTARPLALDDARRRAVAERSGEAQPPAVVHTWEARRDGALIAIGYLDAHVVRSKRQVLLVVVDLATQTDRAARVRRIEVLAFAEPQRFRPAAPFYDQFRGRALDDDLREGRGIRRVAGATMTARATTAAVRRVLALHAVAQDPCR